MSVFLILPYVPHYFIPSNPCTRTTSEHKIQHPFCINMYKCACVCVYLSFTFYQPCLSILSQLCIGARKIRFPRSSIPSSVGKSITQNSCLYRAAPGTRFDVLFLYIPQKWNSWHHRVGLTLGTDQQKQNTHSQNQIPSNQCLIAYGGAMKH